MISTVPGGIFCEASRRSSVAAVFRIFFDVLDFRQEYRVEPRRHDRREIVDEQSGRWRIHAHRHQRTRCRSRAAIDRLRHERAGFGFA